eukprot:767471-Hanusia_phi.AAC.9
MPLISSPAPTDVREQAPTTTPAPGHRASDLRSPASLSSPATRPLGIDSPAPAELSAAPGPHQHRTP